VASDHEGDETADPDVAQQDSEQTFDRLVGEGELVTLSDCCKSRTRSGMNATRTNLTLDDDPAPPHYPPRRDGRTPQ
jgi:hypothetical protein